MSRKYSIGFLVIMIILSSLFVYGFQFTYDRLSRENPNAESESEIEDNYYIQDKNGYVTVYHSNGSVYEYTSILVTNLPKHVQDKMSGGIYLKDLAEVYGFLENYSS